MHVACVGQSDLDIAHAGVRIRIALVDAVTILLAHHRNR